jgi:hypothetical protein
VHGPEHKRKNWNLITLTPENYSENESAMAVPCRNCFVFELSNNVHHVRLKKFQWPAPMSGTTCPAFTQKLL